MLTFWSRTLLPYTQAVTNFILKRLCIFAKQIYILFNASFFLY